MPSTDLRVGTGTSQSDPLSCCVLFFEIRVGMGRHFDRGTVSREMFIWLHLINPVTVDCIRGVVILGAHSACFWEKNCQNDSVRSIWSLSGAGLRYSQDCVGLRVAFR